MEVSGRWVGAGDWGLGWLSLIRDFRILGGWFVACLGGYYRMVDFFGSRFIYLCSLWRCGIKDILVLIYWDILVLFIIETDLRDYLWIFNYLVFYET